MHIGILGTSRLLARETCYGRAPHLEIIKLEFDALALLQLIDTDTIQCVRTKKEFVCALSRDKTTAKLSQDLF